MPLFSQSPKKGEHEHEREKIHAKVMNIDDGLIKIGFINRHRKRKLLERIDHFLIDNPPDIRILFRRSDIYLENKQIDLAIQDFKTMLEICGGADQVGGWAKEFSFVLIDLVREGYTQYKEDCCYFNKLRIKHGIRVQICMDSMRYSSICGCEEDN